MDITESFAKAIILESNDTFKKINEKRIKKGKPAFSEEQYLDYSIKQCKKSLSKIKLYISLFLVIALPLSLLGESFLDKLSIFGMILALFSLYLLPAYWFGRGIRKINKILLKKYTYFKENNILMKDWK